MRELPQQTIEISLSLFSFERSRQLNKSKKIFLLFSKFIFIFQNNLLIKYLENKLVELFENFILYWIIA